MKIKVNPGWQLGIETESKRYQPGDTFDAPDDVAAQWIAAGQAVEVKAEKKAEAKAVTEAPNKAVTESANKSFTTAPKAAPKTAPK